MEMVLTNDISKHHWRIWKMSNDGPSLDIFQIRQFKNGL